MDTTNSDLSAGKHCPKGKHLSYRTPGGVLRASPKCVRHSKGHKRSYVPKTIRYERGLVSSPAHLRFSTKCRRGYHRSKTGRSCVRNKVAGGETEQQPLAGGETVIEQQPLAGGAWWFQSEAAPAAAAPAAAAPAADAVTASVEGGTHMRFNDRCPKGQHISYRTPSGRMRASPKCVRHSKGHKRSPRLKAATRHCRKGYHKVGKSCRRNKE